MPAGFPVVEAAPASPTGEAIGELVVETVYAQNADFVWRSLQRVGVEPADLEDAFQEVFVVVQRRLPHFERRSKLTTWLFGICLRVAKRLRRRAWLRGWVPKRLPEPADLRTPERHAEQREARRQLRALLGRLSPEQLAVFSMFEFEQMDCTQIAQVVGVPVGTVYSRLHTARARMRQEYERRFPRASWRTP